MIYNEQTLAKFSEARSRPEILLARETQLTIRKAVEAHFDIGAVAAKYNFKPELVPFLQGSYRNNTHVAQSSDVDVVVRIKNLWKDNREVLPLDQRAKYEAAYSNVSYPFEVFHQDILKALTRHFGAEYVKSDQKCIKVLAHDKYGTADVIPCFSYRLYGNFQSIEQDDYKDGICFFANDGRFLRNFPKLHIKALSEKCAPNNAAFKEAIRMFKNMRDDLIDKQVLYPDMVKSYFIENLLHFLPDSCFIGTRLQVFEQIMSVLRELDKLDLFHTFKCANGVDLLFSQDNWYYPYAQLFLNSLKMVQNEAQF